MLIYSIQATFHKDILVVFRGKKAPKFVSLGGKMIISIFEIIYSNMFMPQTFRVSLEQSGPMSFPVIADLKQNKKNPTISLHQETSDT